MRVLTVNGVTQPAGWFYKRVWAVSSPSVNLKQVTDLVKHFPIHAGVLQRTIGLVQAVDGVSFTIRRGEPTLPTVHPSPFVACQDPAVIERPLAAAH